MSQSRVLVNDPAAGKTRLVVVGASGMVGGYALRYALDHPSVGVVTVIGRRKLDISNSRIKEVLHRDFGNCSALAERFHNRTRLSFAWARIPALCQTRSSAG